MAETRKIIIAEIKNSDKFFNIKDNNGVEYGISKEKSPILSKQLESAKVGDEITAEYFLWKEKHYLSDIKETGKSGFGGKSFVSKDKSYEAAIASINAAASLYSFDKDKNMTQITSAAETFHAFIMSKVTKTPESAK